MFIILYWTENQLNQQLKNVDESFSVKIAVIDSGIDSKVSGVRADKVLNQKEIPDSYGHGTAIASIIKTTIERFTSMDHLKTDVIFYDVNVLDESGKAEIDQIIKSIKWAMEQDVDIINMSFGIPKDDDKLHQVIKEAHTQNIIIIAAAGNRLGMESDYPARYPEVLSISSVDPFFQHDPMAAKGKIDYVAPGVGIQTVQIGKMEEYETLSGTSFAAAYSTGIIATLLRENKISRKTYKRDLEQYVQPLGDKKVFGKGLLHFNENQ